MRVLAGSMCTKPSHAIALASYTDRLDRATGHCVLSDEAFNVLAEAQIISLPFSHARGVFVVYSSHTRHATSTRRVRDEYTHE